MAELVYAFDLKSNEETHMGSSPISGTRLLRKENMDKKAISIIYASFAMVSVGIMVIIGTIIGSWDKLWLIPFGAMIIATVIAMIASYKDEKKQDKKK